MAVDPEGSTAVVDGGSLDCNGGLLIAIRRALVGVPVGALLEVRSEAESVAEDLPAWCEIAGHRMERTIGVPSAARYLVRRGR